MGVHVDVLNCQHGLRKLERLGKVLCAQSLEHRLFGVGHVLSLLAFRRFHVAAAEAPIVNIGIAGFHRRKQAGVLRWILGASKAGQGQERQQNEPERSGMHDWLCYARGSLASIATSKERPSLGKIPVAAYFLQWTMNAFGRSAWHCPT